MPNSGDSEAGRGFRSGYVALAGTTNVGKSTFLNKLLGRKVSIVAHRPQTTRNRIVGIRTIPGRAQIVLLDTPGIHRPEHALGNEMIRTATAAVADVDLVVLMVEPRPPRASDLRAIEIIRKARKPALLLINKIDAVAKPALLPVIEAYRGLYAFADVFPVSALTGEGVEEVIEAMVERLPEGPQYYADDMYTDMVERFMVAEIVREKVIRLTDEEVPHAAAVEVTRWDEQPESALGIGVTIYVEKDGQKGIIIGKGGERLKAIGTAARREIERLVGTKVFLELWVKVRKKWRSDRAALTTLGY